MWYLMKVQVHVNNVFEMGFPGMLKKFLYTSVPRVMDR